MRAIARYKRNTALLPLVPMLLVLLTYVGWSYMESTRPEPYETYDRQLSPPTSPAAAPFDDPSLPYTFTVPAGLVAMPDTGGADVRLAPEAWFPTDAAIILTTVKLEVSGEDPSDEALIAAARKTEHGPGPNDEVKVEGTADGSRVLTWPGCCSEPVPFEALIYHGKQALLVATDVPDDGDDTSGYLESAARELIGSLNWR